MIKIKIEQVTTRDFPAVENYIVSEEVVKDAQGNVVYESEDSYGARTKQKAVTNKRYATQDITKQTNVTVTLLEQEIVDDSAFDLGRVILAINRASIPLIDLRKGD